MFDVKQLPQLWNCWNPDKRYGNPYISSIMLKTRCLKISQYLHLTDSTNASSKNDLKYDPLFKVRPVIDLLVNNYEAVYLLGKNLSVDETMIGYKGRVHFWQYMPAKPTKWGIKIWEVCESETGYCVNFDVYKGKKYNGNKLHGLGHDFIWALTGPFHHQHQHLYFNRFFFFSGFGKKSCVSTYTCSTVMGSCKGLSREMKTKF
ncbi:piggyBac transposable element-derived protein 4-like [Octopus bimaculoides]|uniref:piggyBac transposable element-derived protein 4-like n=1 Tax=Octopus bimaculoides TaxID=37653 RepID=UPI0022E2BCE2|nr:piggyBac transposable element-derived protein 4-like [Octopus bimaculoides]